MSDLKNVELAIVGDKEVEAFFGAPPTESDSSDLFHVFECSDSKGMRLVFSYYVGAQSVQVVVFSGETMILRVCQEGWTEMKIGADNKGSFLNCRFDFVNAYSILELRIHPEIEFTWDTLLSAHPSEFTYK